MRRLVIDTNIYIDWLNDGRYEEVLFQSDAVKHLSGIVLMELRAGVVAASDRRALQRIESAFEKSGRVLLPSRAVFVAAGDALRRLQSRRGFQVKDRHS